MRGDIETVLYALDVRGDDPTRQAFENAAGYGHLQVLEILSSRVTTVPSVHAYDAAKGGNIGVLRWLHENNGVFSAELMGIAARYGHLLAVQWLHNYRNEGCSSIAVGLAARGGHLELVKWLCRNRADSYGPEALLMAVRGGNVEVVEWLHRNISVDWEGDLFNAAALSGSKRIVEWAVQSFPEGSCTALDYAARSRNREVFRMIRTSDVAGFRGGTMSALAAKGDLESLIWMIERHDIHCPASAMDNAAANGHLHIVKWLHDHSRGGCTASAMDRASAIGHLEVVRWLHKERGEGCTTLAMDVAALNGHDETPQHGYLALPEDTLLQVRVELMLPHKL